MTLTSTPSSNDHLLLVFLLFKIQVHVSPGCHAGVDEGEGYSDDNVVVTDGGVRREANSKIPELWVDGDIVGDVCVQKTSMTKIDLKKKTLT